MTRRVNTLKSLGLSKDFNTKLVGFIELFDKWNKSINLSAAKSQEDIDLHVIDCLHIVPLLADRERVIDVGSGGGLPVVVAAICLPSTGFTAIEPVHKKHAFIRTAARELALPNLEAFARRIEDHPDRDYDAASSRATFDLDEWLRLGLTLVKPDGIVIGFEGVERTDLSMPIERHPYELQDRSRALVVARNVPRIP
jgi:16S rRNA (guanine527-N7)-methyltransferase